MFNFFSFQEKFIDAETTFKSDLSKYLKLNKKFNALGLLLYVAGLVLFFTMPYWGAQTTSVSEHALNPGYAEVEYTQNDLAQGFEISSKLWDCVYSDSSSQSAARKFLFPPYVSSFLPTHYRPLFVPCPVALFR